MITKCYVAKRVWQVRVDLRRGFRACRYIYFKKIKKERRIESK